MNSPGQSNVRFLEDKERHKAIEIVGALHNLLYLIRLNASKRSQVVAHAEQSEKLLLKLQEMMLETVGGEHYGSHG